jgi:hypothetical protein
MRDPVAEEEIIQKIEAYALASQRKGKAAISNPRRTSMTAPTTVPASNRPRAC